MFEYDAFKRRCNLSGADWDPSKRTPTLDAATWTELSTANPPETLHSTRAFENMASPTRTSALKSPVTLETQQAKRRHLLLSLRQRSTAFSSETYQVRLLLLPPAMTMSRVLKTPTTLLCRCQLRFRHW